ncbi:MAG TPA: hypothetical protein VGN41_06560, partial [Streptosporangiaceae bacterium]
MCQHHRQVFGLAGHLAEEQPGRAPRIGSGPGVLGRRRQQRRPAGQPSAQLPPGRQGEREPQRRGVIMIQCPGERVVYGDVLGVQAAEAGRVVLRLVGCSLVLPPRTGPDGRSRYGMLETLRAYAAGLLAEAGEEAEVSAALAAYAAGMSMAAAVEINTRGREVAGLRRLDAEDVTVHHALAWALDHDPATALRLALTLTSWWQLRGRLPSQAPLLAAAAEHARAGTDAWCKARLLLG